jgi:hypothetical protein
MASEIHRRRQIVWARLDFALPAPPSASSVGHRCPGLLKSAVEQTSLGSVTSRPWTASTSSGRSAKCGAVSLLARAGSPQSNAAHPQFLTIARWSHDFLLPLLRQPWGSGPMISFAAPRLESTKIASRNSRATMARVPTKPTLAPLASPPMRFADVGVGERRVAETSRSEGRITDNGYTLEIRVVHSRGCKVCFR